MKKVFSAEEKEIFDMYMADRGQFPEIQNPRMRKKEDLLFKKLEKLFAKYSALISDVREHKEFAELCSGPRDYYDKIMVEMEDSFNTALEKKQKKLFEKIKRIRGRAFETEIQNLIQNKK